MRPGAIVAAALLLGGIASFDSGLPALAQDKPADSSRVDFVRDVRPILRDHCNSCHSASKKKGQLRLDARSAAMRGDLGGKAIVPGKAAESPLYKVLVDTDDDARMPQKAPPLPKEKIE